jgi:hypothetical protein
MYHTSRARQTTLELNNVGVTLVQRSNVIYHAMRIFQDAMEIVRYSLLLDDEVNDTVQNMNSSTCHCNSNSSSITSPSQSKMEEMISCKLVDISKRLSCMKLRNRLIEQDDKINVQNNETDDNLRVRDTIPLFLSLVPMERNELSITSLDELLLRDVNSVVSNIQLFDEEEHFSLIAYALLQNNSVPVSQIPGLDMVILLNNYGVAIHIMAYRRSLSTTTKRQHGESSSSLVQKSHKIFHLSNMLLENNLSDLTILNDHDTYQQTICLKYLVLQNMIHCYNSNMILNSNDDVNIYLDQINNLRDLYESWKISCRRQRAPAA